MAKTSNTKKTANTQQAAASAPGGKKSALPIIAAVLFLLSDICFELILMSQRGEGYRWHPGLSTFLSLFLIISLFLRRDKDLVPAAVALMTLSTVFSLLRSIVFGGGIGVVLNYYNLVMLVMKVMTLLLALPNLRDKMRKVWWLPAVLGAVIISIGVLIDASYNSSGSLTLITLCLDVYAYFFLCAWLAFPNMTFRGMINSTQKEPETFASLMLKWLVQGVGVCIGLMVILCIVALVQNGNLDIFLKQPFFFPTFLFICPVAYCVARLFSAMPQAIKETKRMKHDMNVIKSSMGGAIGAQAKAELRKEAGKKAANAVIKGALVGDLIGGDTGAVVGAMAAKAKLDQATGSGGVDGVAKDAVTGGLITGSSSAVVGGLAAQAQKDAENSIK